MAATLPGEGQRHDGGEWRPQDHQSGQSTTTKIPGLNTLVDNILDFIVKQVGASSDREVYRQLAEKQAENILKNYQDVNTGPKEKV